MQSAYDVDWCRLSIYLIFTLNDFVDSVFSIYEFKRFVELFDYIFMRHYSRLQIRNFT